MKVNFNSIPMSVFKVNTSTDNKEREEIIAGGRLLAREYARNGVEMLRKAMNTGGAPIEAMLNSTQYSELNERFQKDHFLYAAKLCCQSTGEKAPADYDEFKRRGKSFYGNSQFFKVLQGIYQDIVNPILPAVYSEAVSVFADVVEVSFGETYTMSVGSNDIPIFQDSAWGASRSVPRNRFYTRDFTLNPSPRTAQINAKWTQLVGNGMDFGKFFANITAGLYAKTMGMWNEALVAAASDTSLVPSGLTYAFNSVNWVTLANKMMALNSTSISNIIAYGNLVALSKVLPTEVTGSTNVNMDAAIATLLGTEYNKNACLGEYMAVRLMPLTDAVIPGTQNGNVSTILDSNKIWMMASNARKPMTIVMNSDTPITIEFDPTKTADFEIGINMTIALDTIATFSSRVGLVTIA